MTSTDKARAHAKHAYYCSCGRVVRGNGARWSHGAAHRRRSALEPAAWMGRPIPRHHYVTREEWERVWRPR